MSSWESSNINLLASSDILELINELKELPAADAALKLSGKDVPRNFIVNQIQGMQIAKRKFPFLLAHEQIIYPSKVHLEQASSQVTGEFKAEQFFEGKHVVDGTAGFGIDTMIAAQVAKSVLSFDPAEHLNKALAHNIRVLQLDNVSVRNSAFDLAEIPEQTDIVYLDPDRRASNSRSSAMSDAEPNVIANWKKWMAGSQDFLLKLSPMVDIQAALSELSHVKEVHVVAFRNEVKELLLYCVPKFNEPPMIHCWELNNKELRFDFTLLQETYTNSDIGPQEGYIYFPSAAITKAGAFKAFGETYSLKKLAPHTHMYTASAEKQVMGRCYKVESQLRYSTSNVDELKSTFGHTFNIITRNIDLQPKDIVAKHKLHEGGDLTLIVYKDHVEERQMTVCSRIY